MKTTRVSGQPTTRSLGQQNKIVKRPENKDNLDSRETEEQDDRGQNTTHNKKENHGAPKKKS